MSNDVLAAFIMPHFGQSKEYLEFTNQAIESIVNQTDENWCLVIVDDYSAHKGCVDNLREWQKRFPNKLHLLFLHENRGPGVARNVGIDYVKELGAKLVLYADADDTNHPDRLREVKKCFNENNSEDMVIYSTFALIGSDGKAIDSRDISPSIQEILEAHRLSPPEGHDAWKDIGINSGYVNLTSTTAVTIELACKYKFPEVRISEDAHTWFRYSAGGGKFIYIDQELVLYRVIPQGLGSASRERSGTKEAFLKEKIRNDYSGFCAALNIALQQGRLKESDLNGLKVKFLLRSVKTLQREGQSEFSSRILNSLEIKEDNFLN